MRIALLRAIIFSAIFALVCVIEPLIRSHFGTPFAVARVVFFLGSLALLAGFVWAGQALVDSPHYSLLRATGAVVFIVIGFVVAWVLAVNVGRIASGILRLPV